MSDENKDSGRNGRKGSGIKVPSPRWLLWILVIGIVPFVMIFRRIDNHKEISRPELITLLEKSQVRRGIIRYTPSQWSALHEIVGTAEEGDKEGNLVPFNFKIKTLLNDELERQLLNSGRFETREPNTVLLNIIVTILPILLAALVI